MYTDLTLLSILPSLSSLTLAELKVLQENIDSMITIKNIGNNQENIEVHMCDSFLSHNSTGSASVRRTVLPQESYGFLQLEQLKNYLNQKSSPVQKSDRPLGVWKGKVRMSDDFDELSSDIISEFGLEE